MTLINSIVGNCPTNVPIGPPCTYVDQSTYCDIRCAGNQPFDIKATFSDLNRKLGADKRVFRQLDLSQLDSLTELPANALGGLQFEYIQLYYTRSLTRIHVNAFNGSVATINRVDIHHVPVTEHVAGDWNLFGAISTLKGLKTLYFRRTGVNNLPSMGLHGLKNLYEVWFDGNPIKSILPNAFNNLPSMLYLQFTDSSPIDNVADHAFTVGRKSTPYEFKIDFQTQPHTTFNNRSFESIGCPTTITLGTQSTKYLDRNVFEVFLSENAMNKVFDESIDCADSRNQWIKAKYPLIWRGLRCG
ncbi:unnamed protein product [Medioppia subpectinata]|uniref:Uncharacterized protein n=1 Tax=Medioppia subpectinata TaxID=1979941 RepID=A0A7R9LJY1_9ACAR|nr:unnamed protein product [Medioppia subpectinata]CAG2118910.1 unnamed protein product [Medioppia subpectinata]